MTAAISKALLHGYNARTILNRIANQFPNAANAIYTAQTAGYAAETILQAISDPKKKNKANAEDYLTEHEKIHKRGKDRQKRSALTALGALGTAGAVGAGLYSLSQSGKAVQPSAVLPAIRGQVQGRQGTTINISNPRLGNTQRQVPGKGTPPQISFNPLQNPPNNPPPQAPKGPNKPNGSISPTPQNQGPKVAPQVGMPPVKIDPQQSVNLVKNLKAEDIFNTFLQKGDDPSSAALILQKILPKEKLSIFEKIEGGLEKVVEDYGMFLQSQQQQQQPQEQQVPQSILQEMMGQQKESESPHPTPGVDIQEEMIAPQFRANQPQEMQEQQEQSIEQELPEDIELPPITQPEPIKKSEHKPLDIDFKKLAILPKGKIGTIESIENGVAKINVDGKTINEKVSNLNQEPEGLEEAVRHIVKSIPESLKSTSMQSIVHIPGINIMLTQFYDGKWAWYKDFPEDIYRNIAIGSYEPKGEAKTGIGEYKPGVVDSRGAGFDQEVKKNPKYSKENKGITWDYATNEYALTHTIQKILHKISKEKYDENGNLIITKPRKKSST